MSMRAPCPLTRTVWRDFVLGLGVDVRAVVEMMSGVIWVRDTLAAGGLGGAGRARAQGA